MQTQTTVKTGRATQLGESADVEATPAGPMSLLAIGTRSLIYGFGIVFSGSMALLGGKLIHRAVLGPETPPPAANA